MKRSRERCGETLERLLGQRPGPSAARMESGISRVWQRLHSEIVEAPAEIASEPLAVRRPWTMWKTGLIAGIAAAAGSVGSLPAAFLRSLRHRGPSADE